MSYNPGLKGLFTETNAQDAGEATLKAAVNVNVNQDGKIESRHGLNKKLFAHDLVANDFRYDVSSMGVYKIPLKPSISGNLWQYVILNDQSLNTSNIIVAGVINNLTENPTFYGQTVTNFNVPLEKKPVAFHFDQSFYISTPRGWLQTNKDNMSDTSPTNNYKIIAWPSFSNIHIETLQDTYDFNKNWISNSKKVGIRITYLWNTRYNEEDPRIVESSPSNAFEIFHVTATKTYSGILPLREHSKIRVLFGYNPNTFNDGLAHLQNYTPTYSGGRPYAIRVYRTKETNISDILPPDYRQAAPDLEIGNFVETTATAGTSDFITSGGKTYIKLLDNSDTRIDDLKTGIPIVFDTQTLSTSPIDGVRNNLVYYIGESLSGNPGYWTILATPYSLSTPLTLATVYGTPEQFKWKTLFEIELTVNDDGIIQLPELYTNVNQDGDGNDNGLPPITEVVETYKGYTIAGNIRDPLRAYMYLVAQPLAKEVNVNISVITSATSSLTATLSQDDLVGLSTGTFASDSPFIYDLDPDNISAGNMVSVNLGTGAISASGTTRLPFAMGSIGTLACKSRATLFDYTEEVYFETEIAGINYDFNVSLLPVYNRCGPYKKTTDKGGEWLQYSGLTKSDTTIVPYAIDSGSKQPPIYIYMPAAFPSQASQRGRIPAPITSSTNNITLSAISTSGSGASQLTLTLPVANAAGFDIKQFASPGIFVAVDDGRPVAIISYQSYTNKSTTSTYEILFTEVNAHHYAPGSNVADAVFYIPGSSFTTAPLYYAGELYTDFIPSPITYDTGGSRDPLGDSLPVIPVSLLPVNGFSSTPIADVNAPTLVTLTYTYFNDGNPLDPVAANLLVLSNPRFRGVTALSVSQLLDKAVTELVERLNRESPNENIKFIKGKDTGEFIVEVYGGEYIKARHSGKHGKFEPSITNNATTDKITLVEYKENLKNAVAISRLSAPESFPGSQVLAPLRLGNENKKIMSIVKNADECYILKEDGIWQLRISSQTSVPFIDSVVQIDTTTYVQVENAAKELNEEIIFLSQKGFMGISGSSVQPLGRQIETKVKTDLQSALGNNLGNRVRAWVNEQKRIYGCTIWTSSTAFTTYVFNAYTREWTTWDIPIIDATTDESGRTVYLIAELSDSTATGNNFVNVPGFGTPDYADALVSARWSLSEEVHTSGLDRNELDQWDYYFKPSVLYYTPSVNSISFDATSGNNHPLAGMDDISSNGVHVGASQFLKQKGYYRFSDTFYPITFTALGETLGTFTFDQGLPSGFSTSLTGTNGLYAGVRSSITLNPTGYGTPDTNKQFSEYHVHVEEAVKTLTLNFSTDSRSTFTSDRTYAYNATAVNRTVYRTFIPVEASRGRWFIRRISHSVPGERLILTGQTHVIRDLYSTRVQKSPR